MENIIIPNVIVTALACLLAIYNYRTGLRLKRSIPETLGKSIKTLAPGNRYIITLPASMTDAEFDNAFKELSDHLDLENSNTYVVIMHGDIQIVEFS